MKRTACLYFLWLAFLAPAARAEEGVVIPPEEEVFNLVKGTLGDKDDYIQRKIKRAGNKTIDIEAFIAADGDPKLAAEIFSNYSHYGDWALKNINQKGNGNTYFFQIVGAGADPEDNALLKASFLFDFPFFRHEMHRRFKMAFSSKADVFTLVAETITEKSPIGKAKGFMRIWPAPSKPGKLWLYIKGEATLTNWFLYEALPDKVLNRETGERIQLVVNNYQSEEERLRQVKLSRTPIGKKEARDGKPSPPRPK